MNGFKNVLKLGLATALILVLVAVAFMIGYEVGNDTNTATRGNGGEQPASSQVQPTATVVPTLLNSATPAAVPTGSPTDPASPQQNTKTPSAPSSDPTAPEPTASAEPEAITPVEELALTDDEALDLLREAWDLIDGEYFGELPPPQERAYGAIRGMLETLDDDYTSFSEPSIAEIRRIDATGSFEGIGATVRMNEDDVLEIVETYTDSPAENAGLLPGDQVLEVDGQSIVGYSVFDAVTLIRGPEGSEVILTIQREGTDPFKVTIIRARLDIPIIESRMLEDNVGYVRLFDFTSPATIRLQETLEQLFDRGATSLILDLRGNPGGFLDQAIQVSDLFLDEGLILIERRSDGQELEFTSTDDGLAMEIPLVILVNGGSASASEIVAGAIQDRERGVLIGETTFGKGSVQLVHALSDGSELRVTFARWFTPNDRAIHGEGLKPDIDVPLTPEDLEAGRDPQLERAIEYLMTGQ